ncbi:MAG: hypothetical protein PVH07_10905 [Chloroflexota bacterium]|jgi:hypothetical protein
MTRVLVVHHDIDLADQEVESLRRLGYEPVECAGPAASPCPVLRGEDCPDVANADVLVYDAFSTTEPGGGQMLIDNLVRMYPDTPIVVTSAGMELEWEADEPGGKVVPLVGMPTAERLDAAIKEALAR